MSTGSHPPRGAAATARSAAAGSPADLLAAARQAFADNQFLLAFDDARRGLEADDGNLDLRLMAAKALIEARDLLRAGRHRVELDEAGLAALAARVRAVVTARYAGQDGPADSPPAAALAPTARAATSVLKGTQAEEALGLVGRLVKEIYRESRRVADATRAKVIYLAAFAASGGYWTCINVATLSRVLAAREPARATAEMAEARLFARMSLDLCDAAEVWPKGDDEAFWVPATRGEAKLLLGDLPGAEAAYAAAAARPARLNLRESVRRQLRFLRDHGVEIPATIDGLFRPPAVLCFSGHMLDIPGRPAPRFPAYLEPAVRAGIARAIDALAAPNLIGYCSAACGGDLLFAELMLERGAQLEVMLPFAEHDFVQTSVARAGPDWVRRFRRIIPEAGGVAANRRYAIGASAVNLSFVTTEPYLGSDSLFGHCNRVMTGAAWLGASSYGGEPHLIAAVDAARASAGGFGTAQMLGMWPRHRTSVVDIGLLRAQVPPPPAAAVPPPAGAVPGSLAGAAVTVVPGVAGPGAGAGRLIVGDQPMTRDVKALLFSDVQGFSSLAEAQVPLFMDQYFRQLDEAWAAVPAGRPLLTETWGDAVYCVMPTALAAAEYARAMQAVAARTDWEALGLPPGLRVRVSLHAGPVFAGVHPLTKARSYFGSHVTRAARIEPITRPGQVYASLPFVALLTAEQAAAGPPPGGWPYQCEYVGRIELAKLYGPESLYQVQPRGDRL